jgi:hypothetical protein
MNKKLNPILGHIYYTTTLATLVLPLIYPNLSELLKISLVMLWVIALLGLGVVMFALIGSVSIDRDSLNRVKENFNLDNKSYIHSVINWVKVVVVTLLSAYNGLIITGIAYFFCCLFIKFGFHLVKDIINQRIEEEVKNEYTS